MTNRVYRFQSTHNTHIQKGKGKLCRWSCASAGGHVTSTRCVPGGRESGLPVVFLVSHGLLYHK